jgi:hypothetical protein
MRRLGSLIAIFVLWGSVMSAERLTTRDIIELSRAGLGDDVLLALIDVSRAVYPIDPATLKQLKDAGVSERVIAALIRSGREIVPEPPPALDSRLEDQRPQPQPQVVVIEHRAPEIREVEVPVPVYVGVLPGHFGRVRRTHVDTVPAVPATRFVPFQQGPPTVWPTAEEPKQPVYWGFGGKRRPDTWAPPPEPRRNPDRK